MVASQGPDHDKTFEVSVSLGAEDVARASGKSKKEAEQRAAEQALLLLEADPGRFLMPPAGDSPAAAAARSEPAAVTEPLDSSDDSPAPGAATGSAPESP